MHERYVRLATNVPSAMAIGSRARNWRLRALQRTAGGSERLEHPGIMEHAYGFAYPRTLRTLG